MTEFFKKLSIYPIHEYWLDIGHKDQFNKAQKDIMKT